MAVQKLDLGCHCHAELETVGVMREEHWAVNDVKQGQVVQTAVVVAAAD